MLFLTSVRGDFLPRPSTPSPSWTLNEQRLGAEVPLPGWAGWAALHRAPGSPEAQGAPKPGAADIGGFRPWPGQAVTGRASILLSQA